jgi:hypothetical protein
MVFLKIIYSLLFAFLPLYSKYWCEIGNTNFQQQEDQIHSFWRNFQKIYDDWKT